MLPIYIYMYIYVDDFFFTFFVVQPAVQQPVDCVTELYFSSDLPFLT